MRSGVLAAAICLLSVTSANAQTAQDYFPNERGNTWSYATSGALGSGSETMQVRARSGGWAWIDGFEGSRWWWISGQDARMWVWESPRYYQLFDVGVGQGNTFVANAGPSMTCMNGSSYTITDTQARITTPAGTFSDCLILRRASSPCADGGITRVAFALGVGIVEYERQTIAGPVTAQLTGATVGGTVYPLPAPPIAPVGVHGLGYQVVDAEFSEQLDAIVTVSAGPDLLHVFDPHTGTERSVALPLTPSCVSISPDGRFAAVGHDAWLSYVDLTSATLVNAWPVSCDVLDVVLAGNGYMYAFPRRDQWEYIRAVEIATGVEVSQTGYSIYAGTKAKLQPGTEFIYGADNGLSPADIEKYDVSGGIPAYLYDSPYHGDFPSGGNVWFSKDGRRIFTRPGTVFRASTTRSQDMIYNGSLGQTGFLESLAHADVAGKVLAIEGTSSWSGTGNEDTRLQVYGYDFLVYEREIALPSFTAGTNTFPAHGKFVFAGSQGARAYVITQADGASGLLNDYAIATVDLAQAGGAPSGVAALPRDGGLSVRWSPVHGATSYRVFLDTTPGVTVGTGTPYQAASSPLTIPNLANGQAYYAVVAAVTASGLSAASAEVTATPSPSAIQSLTHRVVDAEYSDSLDRIVMVSANPSQLHTYDPIGGQSTTTTLSLAPTCVSVAPSGTFAAVGHDGWVSYVDLSGGATTQTFSVTCDVFDVVLGPNGYIYAFPRRDQWETIRSIEIATGVETTSGTIRAGTHARLHPSGTKIYGADNGLSPADLERYDITGGTAQVSYDSPYHGNYAMGGDLWFSEDGARIFARPGTAFRSSDVQAQDMLYAGTLSQVTSGLTWLDHSSSSGKIALIPGLPYWQPNGEDTQVQIYDEAFLGYERTLTLPSFQVNGTPHAAHGKFVFFDSTGDRYFVVVEADASSGMNFDYGVVTIRTTATTP